jgi:hypothetical protein
MAATAVVALVIVAGRTELLLVGTTCDGLIAIAAIVAGTVASLPMLVITAYALFVAALMVAIVLLVVALLFWWLLGSLFHRD